LILHFILGQKCCGAAHRRNVDTPSLGGSCKAAVSFLGANLDDADNLEATRLLNGNSGSCPGTDAKRISEQ